MLETALFILSVLGSIVLGQTIVLMVILINIKRQELKQMVEIEQSYITPLQSVIQNYHEDQ